jgi:hypothetical protein
MSDKIVSTPQGYYLARTAEDERDNKKFHRSGGVARLVTAGKVKVKPREQVSMEI